MSFRSTTVLSVVVLALTVFAIQPFSQELEPSSEPQIQTADAQQQQAPPAVQTTRIPRATPPLSYTPLTNHEKFRYYLKSTYGPMSWLSTGASSAIAQAKDATPEWGQGMEGYSKRYGSRFGQKMIKKSITAGLGAAFNEDPRYFPSERNGIFPRVSYAVTHEFLVRRDSGSWKFADARMIGTFSSSFIALSWRPDADQSTRTALLNGVASIGYDAAWNIFKEFWPDIRAHLRH
jgi:hypothetical protein